MANNAPNSSATLQEAADPIILRFACGECTIVYTTLHHCIEHVLTAPEHSSALANVLTTGGDVVRFVMEIMTKVEQLPEAETHDILARRGLGGRDDIVLFRPIVATASGIPPPAEDQ